MGGEGSMQSANNSLRNNRSLLKKKSLFSREDSFHALKKRAHSYDEEKTEFKKATDKELKILKDKYKQEKQKERRNLWILFILFITITPLVYLQFNDIFSSQKQRIAETKYNAVFNSYLNIGDGHLLRKEWNLAIIQYEKAVFLIPENYHAQHKLASAYITSCKQKNNHCKKAKSLIDQLIKKYPDKEKELLRELNR